jgi:signal transduction histidine kinase
MTRSGHGAQAVGPGRLCCMEQSVQAPAWLPQGALLPDEDWRWRHTAACYLLAAHLPVLLLWAAFAEPREVWHVLLPLAALLLASRLPGARRAVRSLACALGLLMCSALVVHLADGATEAHFHFFVIVAVIALYQDWALYALALVFVLVHHALLVTPEADGGSLPWLLVHGGFVLAEAAVLVLFWRANELSRQAEHRARTAEQRARGAAEQAQGAAAQARGAAEQARAELVQGQDSLQARMAAADRMRADLIGTVSHEFRTPLTSIRAAALTLRKRGDRLDDKTREDMWSAILDGEQRLSRLLENMLVAATARNVDPEASTAVDAVAAEVAMVVAAKRGSAPVSVLVEPGLQARIDRTALYQVLENLLDNAYQHGAAGSTPLVAGGSDEHGVWLTVSNEGNVIDLTRKGRLFEPFTQESTGASRDREGIGVGLYVVRRLVEVYGGSVDVQSDIGWVTVEVRLHCDSATRPLAPVSVG